MQILVTESTAMIKDASELVLTAGRPNFYYLTILSFLCFSIWMNQARAAINNLKGSGTQMGKNFVLWVLFFHLCHLLTLPVIPIFVFDGPD
jgi:hypothetical protein